jgi:selenocysteine-specific elongation factor
MLRVVGTAGHVDHGKSALVEALTGTHPDRLREEREREMTIDLGFAWLTLDDGTEVGFVDVPGHRDFIDNMLAGAGGFQAAILVVAVDEGIMPQTREHLAILDLLQVPRLVVALTKIDLVEDPEWALLVEEDVRRLLAPTIHHAAPVVRVSARSGEGLAALREALASQLAEVAGPRDLGRPRLPVDRAFVMSGFGTVVTGTLLDGGLTLGDEVVVQPAGLHGRIRGLQTHRRAVERAAPGSRVAANLVGIDVHQVGRGDVVSFPGAYRATRRIDSFVSLLPDAPVPLRHGQSCKVYLGTAGVVAKIRLLDRDEVPAGQSGWAQLVLERPVIAAEQDRFILRRPAPPATLGGGLVVTALAERAHRRRDPRVLEALEQLRRGSPADRVLVGLAQAGPVRIGEVGETSGLTSAEITQALAQLVSEGRVVEIRDGSEASGESTFVAAAWWTRVSREAGAMLDGYHREHPLRAGMPREEFRGRLGLPPRQIESVLAGLARDGVLTVVGSRVARAGFVPSPSEEDARRLTELRRRFQAAPLGPPSVRECREVVGDELWTLVTARGDFVEVSDDVVFDADTYRRVVGDITQALARGETVTVAEVRDRFQTSRKYALALLEHLDALGTTVRIGDERRLKGVPSQNPGSPSG